MDISKLKVFNLLQTNMNYLSAKQDVMAENVSNANTPGYGVKKLKPLDFKAVLSGTATASAVKPAATAENHIKVEGNSEREYAGTVDRNPFEITPTGNRVVMEQEMMKLTKNAGEYQQTTSIYRKMMQMLKTSIGEQ